MEIEINDRIIIKYYKYKPIYEILKKKVGPDCARIIIFQLYEDDQLKNKKFNQKLINYYFDVHHKILAKSRNHLLYVHTYFWALFMMKLGEMCGGYSGQHIDMMCVNKIKITELIDKDIAFCENGNWWFIKDHKTTIQKPFRRSKHENGYILYFYPPCDPRYGVPVPEITKRSAVSIFGYEYEKEFDDYIEGLEKYINY